MRRRPMPPPAPRKGRTAASAGWWGEAPRARPASDRRARLPLLPAHVPAVEAVVGGDGLVAGVLDDDHVSDDRVVVEPGARRARVVRALGVGQTHAAVAGVDAAEDGLGAPVVAVDEG